MANHDTKSDDHAARRAEMVRRDVIGRGIEDRRIIDAMGAVPRERFVPDRLAGRAYEDGALPIGGGQTISQPYMVAFMVEAAELGEEDRVLEVGTGSGYGAAVLASVAGNVWTIERLERHGSRASEVLAELGYDNVTALIGDGSRGWSAAAPYDAIVVTAGGTGVPEALREQLVDGGRLIIPVGAHRGAQQLLRIRREGDRMIEEDLGAVAFVPLVQD